MAKRRPTPSWTQRSDQTTQRTRSATNTRARRLRRDQTPSELRLWKALRRLNREGAQFRRQLALDDWVFDFGDLSSRLLIEVDGGVHERLADVASRDVEKTAWATMNGFHLLRFSNDDVWGDTDRVISTIRSSISDPHPLAPPRKGEGGDDESNPC